MGALASGPADGSPRGDEMRQAGDEIRHQDRDADDEVDGLHRGRIKADAIPP